MVGRKQDRQRLAREERLRLDVVVGLAVVEDRKVEVACAKVPQLLCGGEVRDLRSRVVRACLETGEELQQPLDGQVRHAPDLQGQRGLAGIPRGRQRQVEAREHLPGPVRE